MAGLLLVRGSANALRPFLFWFCVGSASVAAAVFVALQPGRLQDLWTLRGWLHYWLEGGNPYLAFHDLDYPPSALLLLWPVSLGSDRTVVLWLLPATIAAAAVGTVLLMRWCSDLLEVSLRWQEAGALVGMVLASSAMRGAIWRGQTGPFAFLFGALALYWCRRRPWLAAVALALCAFKLHIAVGFALAIALTTRRDVVVGASALVLGANAMFAATVDQSLAALVTRYVQILAVWYDGPDALAGLLSLRWVLDSLIDNYAVSTMVYVTLAVSSLGFLVSVARRLHHGPVSVQIAAACLLWSVVWLPHQLYNGLLMWPLVWLVMWPEGNLVSGPRARVALVTGLMVFTVIDVPRLVRWIGEATGDVYFDANRSYFLWPLLFTAFFLFLLIRLARERQPAPGGA